MKTIGETFLTPETDVDCQSMRKCWQCSIYHGAASGEDFFECFDHEKMRKNIQELLKCF